jgi:hypothetical protein
MLQMIDYWRLEAAIVHTVQHISNHQAKFYEQHINNTNTQSDACLVLCASMLLRHRCDVLQASHQQCSANTQKRTIK